MARKRKTPARRDSAGAERYQKWESPTEQQSPPNRRLTVHDPYHLPDYQKADRLELIETLKQMGNEFAIPCEQQNELVKGINVVNIVIATLQYVQGEPPKSEIAESLESIRSQAERLLKHLQITRSPEDIWQNPVISIEINPSIVRALATAARPGSPDLQLIAAIASSIGTLAHLAAIATVEKMPKPELDKWHSAEIGRLYSECFERKPTKKIGGPWLTFLRWARQLAGLSPISDERLRRLPISHPA